MYSTQTSSHEPLPLSVRLSELTQVQPSLPDTFTQIASQSDKLPVAQRQQLILDLTRGWDHVHVRAVVDDLGHRDWRLVILGHPVNPALTLPNREPVNHPLIRHRSPAQGEVDGSDPCATVEPVALAVKHTRPQPEAGQWFDGQPPVLPGSHRLGGGLRGVFGNQDTRRILDATLIERIHNGDAYQDCANQQSL